MPRTSRFIEVTRVALLRWVGAGLLVVAGCSPPEYGSVKAPAELSRGAKLGYGPSAKAGTSPPGPGQFRAAPKTRPGRRRSG